MASSRHTLPDALNPAHWPRWARRLGIVALILMALAVLVRLVLDPVAAHYTRRGLSQLEGMRGDFAGVHVTLFPPGYTITHLKLTEEGGETNAPVFYADSVRVGVDWRRLFHAELLARARIVEPKINVVSGAPAEKAKKAAVKAPDISAQLRQIIPVTVGRVEIVRGELLFRDLSQESHPELWIHRLELATENLATRRDLAHALPTTIAASGVVGHTGKLTLFVTADPFASPLAFAGKFAMVGLRVAELHDFIEPKTKLQTPKGTVDVFAEFEAKNGRFEAAVKPVLKDIEVKAAEPGAWQKVKAWFTNKAVDVASNDQKDDIATIVPVKGRLVSPDVQLLPAVLGVVRNAFIEGLALGFAHLPPPEAPKKQGLLEQTADALKKDNGPPKAQPDEAGEPLLHHGTKSKNGLPLTTSPLPLLQPGAAKKIQERLAKEGLLKEKHASGELDGPTNAALTRFQRKQKLPATGYPDDATIRKLGLDPKEVFAPGKQ
jgi:hypothetical protein